MVFCVKIANFLYPSLFLYVIFLKFRFLIYKRSENSTQMTVFPKEPASSFLGMAILRKEIPSFLIIICLVVM